MANPGPASTQSIHPQGLLSNQALRLIAVAKGVNLGVLGDTAIPVIDTSNYAAATVITANANNAGSAVASISSVYLGVYNLPSQGGSNAILTAAALSSNSATTDVKVVASSSPAYNQSATNLYVNVATATATGTVDVYVYGYDLSGPQQ